MGHLHHLRVHPEPFVGNGSGRDNFLRLGSTIMGTQHRNKATPDENEARGSRNERFHRRQFDARARSLPAQKNQLPLMRYDKC
jgi:hypothetical protein